jgi:hypothetical protein
LRAFQRGDPWLSAGLLKIGDPIYQVKWETNEAQPRLLHIQSIQDVEVFGISAANYGMFVMDQATWESRFSMSASGLQRGVLAPAVPPTPTPIPAATATPVAKLVVKATDTRFVDYQAEIIENEIEINGATPNRRLNVWVEYTQWECSPSCTSTFDGKSAVRETPNIADSNGRVVFTDRHFTYKGYTYYFVDQVTGAKINAPFDDDRTKFGLARGD